MTPNMQMEQFCLAYIRAVASVAGYHVARPRFDMDSVDGVLMSDAGLRPRIEFQAKATSKDVVRAKAIHFPLSTKNYDELRIQCITPRILIVLIMPRDIQDWVMQTPDELCLHRCAYWLSLRGLAESTNVSNITVHIPIDNMFSSAALADMMRTTERRGGL